VKESKPVGKKSLVTFENITKILNTIIFNEQKDHQEITKRLDRKNIYNCLPCYMVVRELKKKNYHRTELAKGVPGTPGW
jgi:hypothetical protein